MGESGREVERGERNLSRFKGGQMHVLPIGRDEWVKPLLLRERIKELSTCVRVHPFVGTLLFASEYCPETQQLNFTQNHLLLTWYFWIGSLYSCL